MTEPLNNSGGAGDNKSGNGAGTDQQGGQGKDPQPNQAAETTTFDPSKVSDEEFAKVFDDPRTFQHSRFKELAQSAQELKQLKANQQKEAEKLLAEQGKFKELADTREKEANDLRTQLTTTRMDNKILAEAQKLGVVDPDAVMKLVDRSVIKVDGDTVTGVKEALDTLVKDKPYLVGKPPIKRLGSGANPDQQNTGELKRFKHSEIQNPEFYRAHEKDILASIKAGLIENDM